MAICVNIQLHVLCFSTGFSQKVRCVEQAGQGNADITDILYTFFNYSRG